MSDMTLKTFMRSLSPDQREYLHRWLRLRETALQQAVAELSRGLGEVSRAQQQLMECGHVLATLE